MGERRETKRMKVFGGKDGTQEILTNPGYLKLLASPSGLLGVKRLFYDDKLPSATKCR